MSDWQTTVLCVSVHRKDENPVYGELATHVSIEDDAAGGYVKLSNPRDDNCQDGEIKLDLEALELITKEAKKLLDAYEKRDGVAKDSTAR